MKTCYRLLSPPERGKHSPKGEVLVADTGPGLQRGPRNLLATGIAGVASYLPWVALSALITIAVTVILNSGMSLSDITHLLVPTARAIGGVVA